MNIIKKFLALVFVLISVTALSDEREWTLAECIEFGIKNHPSIRVAQSNLENEIQREIQAKASYDPRVDARASLRQQSIDRSISGATGRNTSVSESVSISQLISDSGKTRNQIAASKSATSATRARRDSTVIEVAATIKKAYFNVQQAFAIMQVRKDALENHMRHLQRVKAYVEVGTRAHFDITRAKVDVANANVELINAQSRLRRSHAALSRAIGKESKINIINPEIDTLSKVHDSDKYFLLDEAMSRPELRAVSYQIETAQHSYESARASLKPQVSASADYQWSGDRTPQNRQWGMGISVNWPLSDGRIQNSRLTSAKSQIESAKASLDLVRLNINAELENTLTDLQDSYERFNAMQVLVAQAGESLELAEGRYASGLATHIDVSDAQVEYARARSNKVVAFFDSLIAAAELDRVLGRLPKEYQYIPLDKNQIELGEN